MLANRIVATTRPQDYVDEASSITLGIVALDELPCIDPSEDPETNATARLISRAASDYRIWQRRHGFIFTVHGDGTSTLRLLVD